MSALGKDFTRAEADVVAGMKMIWSGEIVRSDVFAREHVERFPGGRMDSARSRTVIFEVKYGGLGDHLFVSALPRLLKHHGLADRVFISSDSRYRSPEIFDLIWRHNPHLDGVSSEPPTPLAPEGGAGIAKVVNRIFARYGLHSPEEFPVEIYAPLDRSREAGERYIDLNYVSFIGAWWFPDTVHVYERHPDHVMVNPDPASQLRFPRRRKVFTKSLGEYASLIASASSFVTLASGGATLAAALRRPSVVYHGFGQNSMFHHGMHTYVRVGGDHVLRRGLRHVLWARNWLRVTCSRNR